MAKIYAFRIFLISLLAFSLTAACDRLESQSSAQPDFKNEVAGDVTPWTHEAFDAAPEKFTFAIVSDLNGGERDGIFDVAVGELALLRPEFVVSLGDAIDGGTEDAAKINREWRSFDARAAGVPAPLFHTPGNHDMTNVAMRQFWAGRYGPRYYHFIYKDALFLVLDSEDYDEDRMQQIYLARAAAIEVLDGPEPEKAQDMEYFHMPERVTGKIGDQQSAYFEGVLREHPDVRWTFLFMHKPVWQREDEYGMGRIEAALGERPYTVINGHFHDFSYRVRNGRDYLILATTGGSQNPESENSFDHVTLVTVADGEPAIANIRLDGVRDKTGHIPADGDDLCYQASKCGGGE